MVYTSAAHRSNGIYYKYYNLSQGQGILIGVPTSPPPQAYTLNKQREMQI